MTATDNDLMDASKFYVEQIHLSIDQDASKKVQNKRGHNRLNKLRKGKEP